MSLLDKMLKATNNEFATIASSGMESDITGFIDTGSYTFNALLSGSMYGGIPDNKIVALAGESATGKTFFAMGICKKFLDDRPDAIVLYFDTEQAITSSMLIERGIDANRVGVFPVSTVEEFRYQAIQIVDNYMKLPKSEKKPILIVLDSLGMLSTKKEMEDTAEGKTTKDMTRTQVIKATFRTLTLKLGQAGIPMLITNHTYAVIGSMFPTSEMSGGSSLKYAASTIIYLSKKKVKDGTDVIGNIIHCKLFKSRLTKENSMVDVLLTYDKGLNPYYGLVDIALKHGILKKSSTKIEFPDGSKAFEKSIYSNPQKYFTPEIMNAIESVVGKQFKYGSSEPNQIIDDSLDEDSLDEGAFDDDTEV